MYVTYIRTTPEKLWAALTDPATMKQYWFGMHQQSDWLPGAAWKLVFPDGRIADAGEIVEADRPKRLVIKWRHELKPELNAEGYSRCTMELDPTEDIVKLTITHVMERADSKLIEAVTGGWPKILSNLKSWLETGQITLNTPYPSRA
jgi:uncharacterized protein YndB with AHSA1/START domain